MVTLDPGGQIQSIECGQQVGTKTRKPDRDARSPRLLQEVLQMFKADHIRIADALETLQDVLDLRVGRLLVDAVENFLQLRPSAKEQLALEIAEQKSRVGRLRRKPFPHHIVVVHNELGGLDLRRARDKQHNRDYQAYHKWLDRM
jgi:hypothetical protein